MKTIAINGRFLSATHRTGTHRSAIGFIRSLLEHHSERFRYELHCPSDANLQNLGIRNIEKLTVHTYPIRGKMSEHSWEQLVWPRVSRADLRLNLISTGSVLNASNQVTVLHDVNPFRRGSPHSFAFRSLARLNMVWAGRRSRRLICFSEETASEIASMLSYPRERISVIPQGPGFEPGDSTAMKRPLQSKYILGVGSFQPHKNLPRLISAFRRVRAKTCDLKLVLVGKPQSRFRSGELDSNEEGIIYTGYIDDSQLESYYRYAEVLVYPSLMEGFGLPIVEAFNCDCPVITSNISCLPEVSGGGADLVDPYNVDEIASCILRYVGNVDQRKVLSEFRRSQCEKYSWRAAAQALIEVLADESENQLSV